MKSSNPFNVYTSKVKRFNIPLPSFNYFHKASSEEMVDSKFIGRERNSKRLYSWLTEEKTKSGSYLITGYRGMGKSSFVGRILYELSIRSTSKTALAGYIAFILIWMGGILLETARIQNELYEYLLLFIIPIIAGLFLILMIYYRYININRWRRLLFTLKVAKEMFLSEKGSTVNQRMTRTEKIKAIYTLLHKKSSGSDDWEKINKELYNTNIKKKSYKRICISINLGQEILNEKDILSLLAHQLYIKYNEYIHSPIANFKHWLLHTASAFILTTIIIELVSRFLEKAHIETINSFFKELNSYTTNENITICLITAICFVTIYGIYLSTRSLFFYSQGNKLRKLKFLTERIEAQINMEKSISMNMQLKDEENRRAGVNMNHKKNKRYPFAETREIEQELIEVLELISRNTWSPQFIFVFDELDKVESEHKQAFNNLEYTNEKNFPGGGTSRKRKQNVLHLLANMKLFISTAKAKFIFIAGRELYDAYLADLSDREFAISSIFNGVIYVESFCTNERREKDIMSNAETYICKQLIPKDFIVQACIEHFIKVKTEGKNFDRLDINLKLYYKYLIKSYLDFFHSYHKPTPDIPKDVRDCIDKAIILLYHFSVYLYHISNGSPKKMSLYFEKYIRSLASYKKLTYHHWDKEKSMLDSHDIDIRIKHKANYCLSFGYIDQRSIGFIHYISFPVTQIIINANQFGDKLLVSASFLINHIYKFHKGGFSWRNMEQTPELLEVYRIPEFRSFINSILSYLAQSHIISITCGLYQFKFRKQFSEEISLASKFSEEIAALFNFTLDESLSVKQHYLAILEDYNQKKEQEGQNNPHVIAGIHVILADLFMADEEYTKAIFEYQTAIKIMAEDEKRSQSNIPTIHDQHAITRMLFLIRNMLKLGLAFEKRKTYESAYVTYNELIGRLIDFRYLDENSLGLNYAIKTEDKEHEAVLYSAGFPLEESSVKKKVRPEINNNISTQHLNTMYSVNGSDIIIDFAHQMTREKNLIIQRLSMLEDIRLIYQAILAKLFVLEKIELGGITRANIELLEAEYTFLHLATNEKNKFLISNDFFRRLGDIMFYKNGLTKEYYKDKDGHTSDKSFMEGLYIWSYNIRTEILDFCNENDCYHLKDKIIAAMYSIKNEAFENIGSGDKAIRDLLENTITPYCKNNTLKDKELIHTFTNKIVQYIQEIPLSKVLACNKHRDKMWEKNKHLPCFACKYYNKSLRLLMKNLFNINIEEQGKQKKCSKVFIILHELVKGGSSKSLRQNFLIQLAEVLDCMGNVMLSCTANTHLCEKIENLYKCEITEEFLAPFLKDVHTYNKKDSATNDLTSLLETIKIYYTSNEQKDITMLEKSLMYYWEAFICFKLGNDFKKAAGSLKKILRTIQKYVKLNDKEEKRKIIIRKYLNEIKERILKQCLINIYAYYNYINIIEIQKIKWIFHVQMYENISLNRLSMFPDIEEIMLVYYDILICCNIPEINSKNMCPSEIEGNKDLRIRLTSIYQNIALGTLRQESTIYERILSLQFKANMNQLILNHLFIEYNSKDIPDYYDSDFNQYILCFLQEYVKSADKLKDKLKEYKYCFQYVFDSSSRSINEKNDMHHLHVALSLLEFLIKDSMYCLTRILEIITPYTSTTLFTNTFMGDIYQMLYKWNQVFDILYMTYRASELDLSCFPTYRPGIEWENGFYSMCPAYYKNCPYFEAGNDTSSIGKSKCPYYSVKCKYKLSQLEQIAIQLNKRRELLNSLQTYQHNMNINLSETFFSEILKEIGKSNIHYTLSNYSAEMSLKFYRQALDMHHEGKSYKDTINKMFYLDDDLKNDTIQFDLALERLRINNGYIDENIKQLLQVFHNASLYDVENFCADNETILSLKKRFLN